MVVNFLFCGQAGLLKQELFMLCLRNFFRDPYFLVNQSVHRLVHSLFEKSNSNKTFHFLMRCCGTEKKLDLNIRKNHGKYINIFTQQWRYISSLSDVEQKESGEKEKLLYALLPQIMTCTNQDLEIFNQNSSDNRLDQFENLFGKR